MRDYLIKKLILVGKLLYKEGLVDARAGNLSAKYKNKMIITRRGSHLGVLIPEDFIELCLESEDFLDERASSELVVHRETYLHSNHGAVVHAHPVFTIRLSQKTDLIEPKDSEGITLLGKVRVLPELPSGSYELAREVSKVLSEEKIVVVRSHGVFSADKEPFYAYSHISVLEHSCKILLT